MAPTATCELCLQSFPSRNALFSHLRDPDSPCGAENGLSPTTQLVKAMLLFCYLPGSIVSSAADAATLVMSAAADAGYEVAQTGCTHAAGCAARNSELFKQDDGCASLADILTLRTTSTPNNDLFVENLNHNLAVALSNPSAGCVRVLGRERAKLHFHAEIHATRRRYEYILPLALLMPQCWGGHGTEKANEAVLRDWNPPHMGKDVSWESHAEVDPVASFLRQTKRLLRRWSSATKRSRWHNYCASTRAVPNEVTTKRRIDRLYQAATPLLPTLQRPSNMKSLATSNGETVTTRRFVVFSIAGDSFLHGQVRRIIALLVAVARGLVPPSSIDDSLDPRVVMKLPVAPVHGLLLASVTFAHFSEKNVSEWQARAAKADPMVAGWRERAWERAAAEWEQFGSGGMDWVCRATQHFRAHPIKVRRATFCCSEHPPTIHSFARAASQSGSSRFLRLAL